MRIITGDLFKIDGFDAIAHGINIYGNMGGGIAKKIADMYPDMERRYIDLCRQGLIVPGEGYVESKDVEPYKYIYNLASQIAPGADARLGLLETSLKFMVSHASINGVKSIGLPLIGGGIGGLDREDVITIMESCEPEGINFTLVEFG